jgi:hypothetical protein
MAGLKKKKREKSGSPNVVLVVFLVLFIIATITLGVFLYLAIDEKAIAQRDMAKEKTNAQTEKTTATYYRWFSRELRQALGYKLTEKELPEMAIDRESFSKGAFDKVVTDKDLTGVAYSELGEKLKINETGFANSYPMLLDEAEKKYKDLEGKHNTAAQEIVRIKGTFKTLTDDQNKLYESAKDSITKGNNEAIAEAKKKSEAFLKLEKDLVDRNTQLDEEKDKLLKFQEEFDNKMKLAAREIKLLKDELNQNAKGAGGAGGGAPGLARQDSSPLVLDISTGKPLWDVPVGKITRVDLDLRQVVINVGSAHGAKPELSFNVFGINTAGRAEKGMKGSIEIIKVLDTNSSLARITSLYDADGYEIQLNQQTRGRILRETEAPLREGDQLFNMFWGTRVAVTGYVSLTGEPSDNPSEQNRQMDDFLFLLRRNGVQVDAWVDLRDGQIKGNISSKTRYLIRGDDLRLGADGKPAAKMPAEDKDGDKEKEKEKEKEPAGKDGLANGDRNDKVNKSSDMLRNDAKALGLLIISAENFATVVGYRKARNANSVEFSNFRPSLPYAGSLDTGVRPQAPMPDEKKAPDPEKKDNN